MITFIHVAPNALQQNANDGGQRPAVIVKNNGKVYRCHGVIIQDEHGNEVCRVIQRDKAPLDGGTRVWVETALQVVMESLENKTPGESEETPGA